MLALQSIVLGLAQGLTEFLPISSSAHLVVIPWLFGWTDPTIGGLSFDVALHLGSLLAVAIFFWKDWVRLAGAWFKSIVQRKIGEDQDRRMAWFLLVACIPGGLAGVLFEDEISVSFHVNPIPQLSMVLMAAAVFAMGVLLWVADAKARSGRRFEGIGLKDALLIGCAQAFAIFPGVSRSGATITAGRALGLDRASAARFSFLLSAPIIAGSGLKSLYEIVKGIRSGSIGGAELAAFPLGFAAAAISGLLCIRFLMGFLQRRSFKVFSFYRMALAALILVVALLRGA